MKIRGNLRENQLFKKACAPRKCFRSRKPDFSKNSGIRFINSRQAEVALGVPGMLRPRIISTFGTTRVVGRQPKAPANFTPGEIPGTHFQRLSFVGRNHVKNPQ
jgi:hypothetical protein